jgi:hypothetical protein
MALVLEWSVKQEWNSNDPSLIVNAVIHNIIEEMTS